MAGFAEERRAGVHHVCMWVGSRGLPLVMRQFDAVRRRACGPLRETRERERVCTCQQQAKTGGRAGTPPIHGADVPFAVSWNGGYSKSFVDFDVHFWSNGWYCVPHTACRDRRHERGESSFALVVNGD